MNKIKSLKFSQHIIFLFLIVLFAINYSFSQNSSKILGSWVYSGNNVYLYDFLDSGKMVITSGKNKGIPTSIDNGWRIVDDSIIYMKEKRGKEMREYSFKIVELDDKKMILNASSANYDMVFYKVASEKKINFSQDFLVNRSFYLNPVYDTICTKISFQANDICKSYRIDKSGEMIEYETWWKILYREDNIYLIINDFEIFVIKEIGGDHSELTVVPYGFFKALTEVNFAKLKAINN